MTADIAFTEFQRFGDGSIEKRIVINGKERQAHRIWIGRRNPILPDHERKAREALMDWAKSEGVI